MFRFTMPEPDLPLPEILAALRAQLDAFEQSEPLRELLALLNTDRAAFSREFNGRTAAGGAVRETMTLSRDRTAEKHRAALYPLLRELGCFDINRPLRDGHSRILVLGGSLDACHSRVRCAAELAGPETRSVDGLACYRPIHPGERAASEFRTGSETEFGAMADSFAAVFGLDWTDADETFHGDRNLNRISCVRTLTQDRRAFRVFAAPSTQPELRRADTGDSLRFYLEHTVLTGDDSLLAVTHNRYCNRQFLQLAYEFLRAGRPLRFDIVGCTPEDRIVTPERYDPFQFLQDLIGVLDWIDRFRSYDFA